MSFYQSMIYLELQKGESDLLKFKRRIALVSFLTRRLSISLSNFQLIIIWNCAKRPRHKTLLNTLVFLARTGLDSKAVSKCNMLLSYAGFIIPAKASREYVFTGVDLCVCVCLSVTTITKKILNGFAPNFCEGSKGKGKTKFVFRYDR